MGGNLSSIIDETLSRKDGILIAQSQKKVSKKDMKKLQEKVPNITVIRCNEVGLSKGIPGELSFWSKVQILCLVDCGLPGLPDGFGDVFLQLEELDLRENSIQDIGFGAQLSTMGRRLRVLRLDKNRLKALPVGLETMQALEVLGLSHNQLGEFPAPVGEYAGTLRELHLGHNSISKLPAQELSALGSLEVLDVSHNRLSRLAGKSLGDLSALKVLKASYNRVGELQASVGALKRLEVLELNFNKLAKLPKALAKLVLLRVLLLDNNNLLELSDAQARQMGANLKALTLFTLDHNPLPPRVLSLVKEHGDIGFLRHMAAGPSVDLSGPGGEGSTEDLLLASTAREVRRSTALPLSGGSMILPQSSSSRMRSNSAAMEEEAELDMIKVQASVSPRMSSTESPRMSMGSGVQSLRVKRKDGGRGGSVMSMFLVDSSEVTSLFGGVKGEVEALGTVSRAVSSTRLDRKKTRNRSKPASLIKELGEPSLETGTVMTLRHLLSSGAAGWHKSFVQGGGIAALVGALKTNRYKVNQAQDYEELHVHLLRCLKVLMRREFAFEVVEAPGFREVLAHAVASASPIRLRKAALRLLCMVAALRDVGVREVLKVLSFCSDNGLISAAEGGGGGGEQKLQRVTSGRVLMRSVSGKIMKDQVLQGRVSGGAAAVSSASAFGAAAVDERSPRSMASVSNILDQQQQQQQQQQWKMSLFLDLLVNLYSPAAMSAGPMNRRAAWRRKALYLTVRLMNALLEGTDALRERASLRGDMLLKPGALEVLRAIRKDESILSASQRLTERLMDEVERFFEGLEEDRVDIESSDEVGGGSGSAGGGRRRRRGRRRDDDDDVHDHEEGKGGSAEADDGDGDDDDEDEEVEEMTLESLEAQGMLGESFFLVRIVTVGTDVADEFDGSTSLAIGSSAELEVRELVGEIENNYPGFGRSEYDWGLWIPPKSESARLDLSSGVWLEPGKRMSDYIGAGGAIPATGGVEAEYRVKPWILKVICANDLISSLRAVRMRFDPHATCADAIAQVRARFPHDSAWERFDWGLYWHHGGGGGVETTLAAPSGADALTELIDTEPLGKYLGLWKRNTQDAAELKMRPRQLLVRVLDDDVPKPVLCDPFAKIREVQAEVVRRYLSHAAGDGADRYTLCHFATSGPPMKFKDGTEGYLPIALDKDKQLMGISLAPGDTLRLMLKMRPVTVMVYSDKVSQNMDDRFATIRRKKTKSSQSNAGGGGGPVFKQLDADFVAPSIFIRGTLCSNLKLPNAQEFSFYVRGGGSGGLTKISPDKPFYMYGIDADDKLFLLYDKVFQTQEDLDALCARSETSSGVVDDASGLVYAAEDLEAPDFARSDDFALEKKRKDGSVVEAGTVKMLVLYAVHVASKSSEAYAQKLLVTHHAFVESAVLFRYLRELYKGALAAARGSADCAVCMRVMRLLRTWTAAFFDDFYDALLEEVIDFVKFAGDARDALATEVLATIESKTLGNGGELGNVSAFSETAPEPVLPASRDGRLHLLDLDEVEVARQLTLQASELLRAIRPVEFIGQCWAKPEKNARCPNLMALIDLFNAVSGGAAALMLAEERVRPRAKVFEKLVAVAQELARLRNFHMLQALVSAFNSAAVLRLKWTRARVSKRALQALADLEALMHMESSYKAYREALAAARPPAVPYMGVYLSDLTFIEEGNPLKDAQGRVNFRRQDLAHAVIDIVLRCQQPPYNLRPVESIQRFLTNLPRVSEAEQYQLSLKREPRNAPKNEIK